ncbi:Oligosaccharyltransferase, beta subunit [Phaffia rhodozyma]|uniref:Dolichyl-diphosphooligosaccharide--protein glycosyltransferase subunit WBP1 n=1 Tax=Phaffia rhodozyma TaxID=264483 RepID=A0A0F7SIF1_PHARH|nr:Oligosaccharyltransferase, beta subunit [Phaffia rhodozyma]
MFPKSLLSVCIALGLAVTSVQAASSTGNRILVALEKQVSQNDYSKFWASLRERGYELTFKSPLDTSPSLTAFDERSFDHVILFTPTSKNYSPDLSPQALIKHLSLNGNILIGTSPSISEFNRDFAREFSIEFQPSDSYLIDHAHFSSTFDQAEAPHTALALSYAESIVHNAAVVSSGYEYKCPVVYRGIAHSYGKEPSPLLVPILHGSKSSYSAEPRVPEGPDDSVYPPEFLAGSKAQLVSGFQTLDNSRVVFAGSIDLFSDKFWDTPVQLPTQDVKKAHVPADCASTGNRAFVKDVTQWAFQEKGVLRVVNATHHRVGETEERELYRIKDDLSYSITLQSHDPNGKKSSWLPAQVKDLQLDFTMLDPHVRVDLLPVAAGAGARSEGQEYSAEFKAPDRHGVFKFLVDYKRAGWSFVHSSQTVSVVPFRHDEYPRFIQGAWPFYSGALSTVGAFVLFCVLWLGWKEPAVVAVKVDQKKEI